ncbi:MAG: crotonase/enoyl-CoA hydratase family protein [Ilumatobacteraceae bacterium]|jgi:enoyl-CoA hydratase|nr:crotonase/enoyl-CoA hydratase family protein [Acidimicrobiaceae bacterium]MBP8210333.1 crotonase/enoyl-CoA hydratase family protein [Ilumatobacteraceae bacterium]HAN37227.1 crotonase/enoyl-CoA hydratase family protein [Acidimicrobiaceae bacterium]HQY85557.1 crotonase/enoyl-CoA hydratase family protein [Ilumatobacteraceae bacterium]HRA84783.1 crotonase/enoyl-CoA hydratase family protein [Ilumatobacteraceae bacterium]
MTEPSPHVTTERLDSVMVVHLDDGKANALSATMIAAISTALDEAEADDTIGAVVLHGRPGRFCAGFDLSVMRGGDFAAVATLVSDGGELVRRLYGSSVPIVAASTGHALAAGALILLGCDVRVGADIDCKIGLNEVAIGMVLPAWAITIAQERLSRRHIQLAVATAQVTDGAGAVQAGFLDVVVPEAEVLPAAIEKATELAALNGRAYAGTVLALRGPVLDRMAAQVTADREAGATPAV